MRTSGSSSLPDANEEIAALIETLFTSERRLAELTGGQVDSVADSNGQPFLLQRAQEQLRKSEAAKQAAILDSLPAHVALLDAQGIVVSVNEAWRQFGQANGLHSRSHCIGLNYLEVCDSPAGNGDSDAQEVATGIRSVLEGKSGYFSHEYPCHSAEEQRWFQLTVAPVAGDWRKGAVVMHVNITARKRAELVSLRLAAIIESSEDAVIGIDLNNIITTWNEGAATIFGYTAAEMIGASPTRLLPTEEQGTERRVLDKIARGESVQHYEARRRTKDGRAIYISVTASPIKNPAGQIVGMAKVARDITDRKRSEEALRLSEERFSAAFEHAPIGVAITSPEGVWLQVNEAFCDLVGYTAAELVGRTFDGITHPADREKSRAQVARMAAGEADSYEIEKRYIHRLGHTVIVRLNAALVRAEDGRPRYLIGQIQDITSHRAAESALKELSLTTERRERMLSTALASMSDFAQIYDRAGRLIFVNQPLLDLWGLTLEAVVGRNFHDLGYPEALASKLQQQVQEVFDTKIKIVDETPYTNQAGTAGHYEYIFSPAFGPDGTVDFVIGTTRDVTERKRAAEVLRAGRESMAIAQRIGQFGSWEIELSDARDIDVNPLRWSDEMYRIAGYEPGAVAVTSSFFFSLIPPGEQEPIREELRRAIREHSRYSIAHHFIRPNGETRVVQETAQIFYDDKSGQPTRIIGTAHDITERIAAEKALRDSNEKFSQLADNITDAFWIRSPDMKQVHYVSPAFEQIWGRSVESLYADPQRWAEFVFVEDRKRVLAAFAALTEDARSLDIEYRIVRPSGELRWVRVRGSQVRNATDQLIRHIGIVTDITERQQAAEALKASEAAFRTLAEAMPQMVWMTRPDGWNIYFSQQWMDYTGLSLEESLGHGWIKPFHPDDQQRAGEAWQRATATGGIYSIECRLRRADGIYHWWLIRGVPQKDAEGRVTKWFGTCTDINELKVAEMEIGRTNQALRAAEEKYRSIFENSTEGIFQRSPDGRFISANPALARILGYASSEQLLLDEPGTLGYWGPGIQEQFDRLMGENGFVSEFEYEVQRSDGNWTWVSENARAVRDHLGSVIYYEGSMQDVTRRRNAVAALQTSEREQRLLAQELEAQRSRLVEAQAVAKVGSWETDLATLAVVWSEETYRIFQADPETFRPTHGGFLPLVHLEDRAAVGSAFLRSLKRRSPSTIEHRLVFPDGTQKFVEQRWQTSFDAQGKPVRVSGTCQDITERKSATEALRISEKRFKALFEQAAVGVAQTDAVTGRFVQINQRFCDILGRTREEMAALTFADVTHPADAERGLDMTRKLQAGAAREFTVEKRYIRRDGTEVWANVTVSAMWAPGESPDFLLSVGQDISAGKRLEDQFRQAQKMDAVGTLAGGIAHDFNNILAAINGYTELTRMVVAENSPAHEHLGAVLKASSRATHLVRQILAFSRQQRLERRPIQLLPVVAESLMLLRATIPSTIEFETSLPTNAPTVLADATQIHQILMNLGTNAWHAMKDGTGRLKVSLERFVVDALHAETQTRLRPGLYARVSVGDTGKGMDKATLQRIFEPFFTTKAPGEGTGLGLSVVHGIMDSHEGAITVYSQPGEGTIFHLYFPAHSVEATTVVSDARLTPRGRGERILFLDDEDLLVTLGKKALTALGYEVEISTQPLEVLETVRAQPERYALVITDQTMPRMTGLALARELQQIRPGLPIILTTGYSQTLKPDGVEAAGVRRLLLKPFSIESLGTAVHAALLTPTQTGNIYGSNPPY